jgi:thiosulfate reductase cytochrome b subunit
MPAWHKKLKWVRLIAMLLDITGGLILVAGVLSFDQQLNDEGEVDDKVIRELVFERRFVVAAAVLLTVSFVLLVLDEISTSVGETKRDSVIASNQFRRWEDALANVRIRSNHEKSTINTLRKVLKYA